MSCTKLDLQDIQDIHDMQDTQEPLEGTLTWQEDGNHKMFPLCLAKAS